MLSVLAISTTRAQTPFWETHALLSFCVEFRPPHPPLTVTYALEKNCGAGVTLEK